MSRPALTERRRADQVARMVRDQWTYVHPNDVAEARDILRRQAAWDTAAVIGAAAIVLAVVVLVLAVWS